MRKLKYCEAIGEATLQAMQRDERIFVMGEGVDDPKGIFGTTRTAYEAFGEKRVFDIPLSENALTGWGTGAALNGMKPLMVHARNDFLLLALDQIVNHAAKWKYMHNEQVPWTIRSLIGRGWGQAAQHSQALHAIFAYIPGLKMVMPATPYDAKGLLMAALADPSPVIIIEHRNLYQTAGIVPAEPYEVPLGKANILKVGNDVTIVAISQMVEEALKASDALSKIGIHPEVIDVRTLRPLDSDSIIASVKKTGRLIVCDVGWKQFGVSAEITSRVVEEAFPFLKNAPIRIGLPDCPTPCSYSLEKVYYPDDRDIIDAVKKILPKNLESKFRSIAGAEAPKQIEFEGPF